MTGIYGIYNTITDKWYVGQAQDIKKRNDRERSYLERGFFHWGAGDNKHLVNAWKKYGPEAFLWVVLEECEALELDDREIFWIEQKNSYKDGYNQTLGGGGCRGYKASEATRRKISENHADMSGPNNPNYGKTFPKGLAHPNYGRKHTEAEREKMRANHADIRGANNPRARGVYQLDFSGAVLAFWPCITEAARSLSINHRNISAVCAGKRRSAGGFIWSYTKEVT